MLSSKTQSLKEQIGLLIADRIETGGKLPTEKEMMNQFGVSRAALRDVLIGFEASGVITSQQGSGHYVKAMNFGEQFKEIWSVMFLAKPSMLPDFLEIRSILEINSLEKAIQSISVPQLQQMAKQVAQMKEKAEKGQAFAGNDREFHRILFSCTNNPLLEQLLMVFWDLYNEAHIEFAHENLVPLAQQHEDILKAITQRDLDTASRLLKEQFEDARYRIVLALIRMDTGSEASSSETDPPAVSASPS